MVVANFTRDGQPISQAGPFPEEGYFSTATYYVKPYPPYHPEPVKQSNVLERLIDRIYAIFMTTLKALKDFFGDINASTDIMQLVINGTKLLEDTFDLPSFKILARGFSQFTDIVSARAWFGRSYDILSLDAMTREPLLGGWDYLRLSNKVLMLVKDAISLFKWFGSIGLMAQISAKEIGWVPVFGFSKAVTYGQVSLLCGLCGSIPNLIDNIRLAVKYNRSCEGMLEQERVFKRTTYVFDCASDICRIASSTLSLLPFPGSIALGLIAMGIGSCISLVKFYYTEQTKMVRDKERESYLAKKAAVQCLCEKYLKLGLRPTNSRSKIAKAAQDISEAKAAVEGVLRGMDKDSRPVIQPMPVDTLATALFNNAVLQAHGKTKTQIENALKQMKALSVAA